MVGSCILQMIWKAIRDNGVTFL